MNAISTIDITSPVPPGPSPMNGTIADARKGRVAAITRGEAIQSYIHPDVGREDPVLQIEDFCLWYGPKKALHNVAMSIPRGKITALIGPSGCGKSTLLRSVNRLNDLISTVKIDGDMRLNGDPIYGRSVDVIELRKRMGMVFQKPNPFLMSIFENVVYPLRIDGERNRGVLSAAIGRAHL